MRNHREGRAGFGFPHGFPMVFPWFSNGFPMIFQFPPKKTRFFQGQGTNSPEQTALRGRNSPSDTSRVPVPEKIYVARSRTEKHTEFSILHTYIYIYYCIHIYICVCMYMYMYVYVYVCVLELSDAPCIHHTQEEQAEPGHWLHSFALKRLRTWDRKPPKVTIP